MKKIFLFMLLALSLNSFSQTMIYDDESTNPYSPKYVLKPTMWNKTHLKYYIYNTSAHLTASQREDAIQLALQRWSAISTLTFEQVSNPSNADLKFKWATGDHGDGFPFDDGGNGDVNVLGHAFDPPSGQIHFDDYENWQASGNYLGDTPNLVSTAIHEIGHAVGLGHSTDNNSIMRNIYHGQTWPGADDVAGIWALYGCPCIIIGDDVVTQSSIFSIQNFPNVQFLYVDWTLSDSYYNQHALQHNNSSQCTITRLSGQDLYMGTLTANIYYNANLIATITKTVSAFSGFKGTYNNGQSTNQIDLPNPLYALPGVLVTIDSPKLIGATVSASGNINSSGWIFNSTIGRLKITAPLTSNSTGYVNVSCSSGDYYSLPIVAVNYPNNISVEVIDRIMEVGLNYDSDNNIFLKSDSYNKTMSNLKWTLEVINVITGKKMFSKEITCTSYTIDTTGWKAGIYCVRATIGDKVLNEKVTIR